MTAGSQECELKEYPCSVRTSCSSSSFLTDSFFVFAWRVTGDQANQDVFYAQSIRFSNLLFTETLESKF